MRKSFIVEIPVEAEDDQNKIASEIEGLIKAYMLRDNIPVSSEVLNVDVTPVETLVTDSISIDNVSVRNDSVVLFEEIRHKLFVKKRDKKKYKTNKEADAAFEKEIIHTAQKGLLNMSDSKPVGYAHAKPTIKNSHIVNITDCNMVQVDYPEDLPIERFA